MKREKGYRVLDKGQVLVEYGPVLMTISAAREGTPLTEAALAGGQKAIELLDELAVYVATARRPVNLLAISPNYPFSLNRMIAAVSELGEDDFTPMAAVAGTFSDIVKDAVAGLGATKIIINNGGDIALKVGPEDKVRVGIIKDLATGECDHVIDIYHDSGIGGIATSGFGGRSLTKGVASAVVTLAEDCARADAAATAVANATNCGHSTVLRCLAEELDCQTDIKGHVVTKLVGDMDEQSIKEAVSNGLRRSVFLYDKGIIKGSVIYVKGEMAALPGDIIKRRV